MINIQINAVASNDEIESGLNSDVLDEDVEEADGVMNKIVWLSSSPSLRFFKWHRHSKEEMMIISYLNTSLQKIEKKL